MLRLCGGQWHGEPPAVALGIARAVFALAVRHVLRGGVDFGAGGAGTFVMRVDVVHEDDEAGIRAVGRGKLAFAVDTVKPDSCGAGANFAVHTLATAIALHAAGFKTECFDQEVVRGLDVSVDKEWNDSR